MMTIFTFKIPITLVVALASTQMMQEVSAFMVRPSAPRMSTRVYIEEWVADLIDKEIYRQSHKKEFEAEWMEKNREAIFHRMESGYGPVDDPEESDFRMHNKDKKLAMTNPEKYCADRCIATGNCDIFEDFYNLSPEDVIKFCTECVLSEEGECDIPEGFYADGSGTSDLSP